MTMIFSKRNKLVQEYYKWKAKTEEKHNVVLADAPLTVITFLNQKGLLNPPRKDITKENILKVLSSERERYSGIFTHALSATDCDRLKSFIAGLDHASAVIVDLSYRGQSK